MRVVPVRNDVRAPARASSRPGRRCLQVLVVVAAMLATLLPAGTASAADTVVLTGFETDDALTGVTLADPDHDRATITADFAAEGSHALQFDIAGTEDSGSTVFPRVWLADATTLGGHDWTAHSRLQVGVANIAPTATTLYIVIRDLDGHYLQRELSATPYGYRVFDILTADATKAGVDLTRLQHIQVSAARSAQLRTLLVDNVRLADSAVDEAAERNAVVPDLVGLVGAAATLDGVDAQLADGYERLGSADSPSYAPLKEQLDTLAEQAQELRSGLDAVDTVAEFDAMVVALQDLVSAPGRLLQILTVRQGRAGAMFGLDSADSMSLVYPKDRTWDGTGRSPKIGMTRGEAEHVQAVVVPYGIDLTGVSVEVTDVRGPKGSGPADLTATVAPVGSLWTVPSDAYGRPTYTGWTPDPIRTDLTSVDIPAGDVQPYLVSVESGTAAPAGQYTIKLIVRAEGQPAQTMTVAVTVWPVTLQDRPELRTAFQFTPALLWPLYGITDKDEQAALRLKYWDFLAEHKIQPDQIYTTAVDPANPGPTDIRPQPVADIVTIEQRYGLTQFTAMYLWAGLLDPNKPETWDAQIDVWIEQIATAMAEYEEAGVADKAVVYGFDESTGPMLDAARHTFARIKERFPDLPTMTTLRDYTFGEATGMADVVDIWVPGMSGYRQDVADAARARGERVWWYHAISNHYPQPNWFNGYPPIDTRMLMGPMSHQGGVEGVLYYAVNRWPVGDRDGQLLVNDAILSQWNPDTFFGTAGDGSLFYPGPEGPMSSLRLENVRDGLEDYNLLQELKRSIAAHPDAPRGLQSRAEKLLGATDIVTDSRNFTEDPADYRQWRDDVARTLQLLAKF